MHTHLCHCSFLKWLSQEKQWHKHRAMKVKGRIPHGSSQKSWFLFWGRAPRDQGTCLPHWHTFTDAQALRQVTDTHRVTKKRTQDLCLGKKHHWLSIAQLIFMRCWFLWSSLFLLLGKQKVHRGILFPLCGEEDEISFLLQVLSVFINSRFIQSLGRSQPKE